MLRFVTAALLASVMPVMAAEITAPSRIDQVTVYPGVATVTRLIEVDVPAGQHTLIIAGLPQALDVNSLRVEGLAAGRLAIGSVELRAQPLPGLAAPMGEIAQKLKTLRESREQKAAEVEALSAKRAMIAAFGQQATTIVGGKDKPVDPTEWTKAWDAVGKGLATVGEEVRQASAALRALDEEIAGLARQSSGGPRPGLTRAANIAVEADAPAKATLKISYQVNGATWRPTYDAALSTGSAAVKPKLALVRRAIITQRTGEDWTDVALSVSTAQARGGTQVPDVPAVRVGFNEPPVIMQGSVAMRTRAAPGAADSLNEMKAMAAPAPAAPASEPVAQPEATLESTGFAAQYLVAGRSSISADGSPRSFRLASRDIEPTLGVRTAPGIDPRAFLSAVFTYEDDAPLLAGEIALTRDGVYVGQGRLAQTAPGDTVDLGFGLDERVKVSRVPVRRRETESTWVQGNRTDLREFRTVVKSLHDRPMRVTVIDQVPFSENSAITVEALPNMTPPTERNVQDKRGVLAWTYEMKPGEEREIRMGFRLRWPGDRELVLEPQGTRPMAR
jgi:uncharacterized protein (TIGR02231 family)